MATERTAEFQNGHRQYEIVRQYVGGALYNVQFIRCLKSTARLFLQQVSDF